MWRDLTDDEIKYFKKLAEELRGKIKFHAIVMLISYVAILLVLFLTDSIKLRYLFEIVEILSINPFMWIFIYVFVKINNMIDCISVKGYTKCLDVKILELVPEDSSKSTDWLANVKVIDTGDIKEKIMCHNGAKIRKLISEKGMYEQAIIVDLSSKRKNKKVKTNSNTEEDDFNLENNDYYNNINNNNNELKVDKEDTSNYIVYDLTNL